MRGKFVAAGGLGFDANTRSLALYRRNQPSTKGIVKNVFLVYDVNRLQKAFRSFHGCEDRHVDTVSRHREDRRMDVFHAQLPALPRPMPPDPATITRVAPVVVRTLVPPRPSVSTRTKPPVPAEAQFLALS